MGRTFCLGGPLLFWLHYCCAAMCCDIRPPFLLCGLEARYALSKWLPLKCYFERFHASAPKRLIQSAVSIRGPGFITSLTSTEQLRHMTDPDNPSIFLSLSFFIWLSVSLWFRTQLALYHPVHRWHIPPDHPGDGVRLLETLQVRATLFLLFPFSPPLSLLFLPFPYFFFTLALILDWRMCD